MASHDDERDRLAHVEPALGIETGPEYLRRPAVHLEAVARSIACLQTETLIRP
jgi:hypothetical protein